MRKGEGSSDRDVSLMHSLSVSPLFRSWKQIIMLQTADWLFEDYSTLLNRVSRTLPVLMAYLVVLGFS